ncbi:MAG: YeeE/YedE family protein [Chloroflexi bacterium]|nr:YeeE/YedE family protein [Chloroflexota bacterium]
MSDSTVAVKETTRPRVSWQTLLGLTAIGGAILVAFMVSRTTFTLPVFWLFGLGFGFILQRSRFCFASAFRDLYLLKDGRVMKGILAGLAIATPGFALVMFSLSPNIIPGRYPIMAAISPAGLHTFVGAFLFGTGMVIGGGCLSGTFYRIGEGYVASMVAMVGIITGFVLLLHTWNWWWRNAISSAPRIWLPHYLGWSGGIGITLLAILAAYLLVLWWESRGGVIVRRTTPSTPAVSFADKVSGAGHTIFRNPWPAVYGGLALGTLNIFEYLFQRPWGLTSEISRWADSVADVLRIAPGPLQGLGEGLGSCGLAAGGKLVSDAFLLNIGMIGGSFIAALMASEFKLRFPRQRRRYIQSFIGGIMIGYGAALALGCNIGAFFSAVPSLGLNAWLFVGGLAVGAYTGVRIIRKIG